MIDEKTYNRIVAANLRRLMYEKGVTQTDMAKALGHALALRLPGHTQCVCLDGIRVREGSFLDIGTPVGPAVAVTVKTLIFGGIS